jgi:hypothetical protein
MAIAAPQIASSAWRVDVLSHVRTSPTAAKSPVDHPLHGLWVAITLDLHADGCAVEFCQVL